MQGSSTHDSGSCEEQQRSPSLTTISAPGLLKDGFISVLSISQCVCVIQGVFVWRLCHSQPAPGSASACWSGSRISLQVSSLCLCLVPPQVMVSCVRKRAAKSLLVKDLSYHTEPQSSSHPAQVCSVLESGDGSEKPQHAGAQWGCRRELRSQEAGQRHTEPFHPKHRQVPRGSWRC